MITKGILRKRVREVLLLGAPYGQTEEMLKDAVDELLPGKSDLTEFRAAREWNHGQEYLRSERNEDSEEMEYFITEKGISKEKSQ